MKTFKHRVSKHVPSKREDAETRRIIARHVASPPRSKSRAGARARRFGVRNGDRVARGLLLEIEQALARETPPPASVLKRRVLQGRSIMHKTSKELAKAFSSCRTAHEALGVMRGLLSYLIDEMGKKRIGKMIAEVRKLKDPSAAFFIEQLKLVQLARAGEYRARSARSVH